MGTKLEPARLFVDMDGTLAEFKSVDTLETLYQPEYFLKLAPNPKVVQAIKKIVTEQPNLEVFILSAVLTDSPYAEKEKNQWLDEHLPEIDNQHRIFPPCGKDKKNFIPNGIHPTDFLLDDYSKNLHLWEPPARGIKLMNGINGTHGTWRGHHVDYNLAPDDLAAQILRPIEAVTNQQAGIHTSFQEQNEPTPAVATDKKMPAQRRNRGGNGKVIQAIKEHFDILQYAEEQYGLHFKTSSKGWMRCVEYDSMYINPIAQTFIRHSRGISGDIINMVAHLDEISDKDAISKLRQEINGGIAPMQHPSYEKFRQHQTEHKPFELPPKLKGQYKRLFGYLCGRRGIDYKIVSDMVKSKLIYESDERHNCVFACKDYDGNITAAMQRSTGEKKFIGEVAGGNKLGWIVNPNQTAMFVGEAPIDMLSVMSMLKLSGADYTRYTFLAQGGNPKHGMLGYHIRHNPNVTKIYLCHDRDEAGQALAKIAEQELRDSGFTGKVVRKPPSVGKDFNDNLLQVQQESQQNITNDTQQEVSLCLAQE